MRKRGPDHGKINNFLNQFINQIPVTETKIEQEVEVDKDWSPKVLIPESKSFFYYEGALPYPPCNPNWINIVFEQSVFVSENIINTLKYILGDSSKNVRDVVNKPETMTIFYNSNIDTQTEVKQKEVQELEKPSLSEEMKKLNLEREKGFIHRNKLYIKGTVLTIIIILMLYVAVKFAGYVVKQDVLNKFIISQVIKRNKRQAKIDKAKMEAEMGGPMMGPPPGMPMPPPLPPPSAPPPPPSAPPQ